MSSLMKKGGFWLCGVIASLFLALNAPLRGDFLYGETECYLGGWGGIVLVQDKIPDIDFDYDMGGMGGVALGLKWWNGLRTEFEVTYQQNTINSLTEDGIKISLKDRHFHRWTALVNAIYDFPHLWRISPYVGAGLGFRYAKADTSGLGLDHNETVDSGVAGQLIGGVTFCLCVDIDLFAEYHYYVFDEHTQTQAVGIGFRWYP